jgi:hypothetical protein
MPEHYKKAEEVPEEGKLEFPEPKATKQYSKSIGPEKPVKEGIFKRVARVAAPGLSGEAEALGKKGVKKLAGGAIKSGIINTGNRVGSLIGHMGVPVWLQDQTRGKRKSTQIQGTDLPPWVFGGGMPWDQPRQSSTVEKVIVTRVHADGTRTTTTRVPTERNPRPKKPSWIRY